MSRATTTDAPAALTELQTRLGDRVVSPEDTAWDEARMAWNLAVDQRPALVVQAASADDVVVAVEVARSHGLRVAPQGTGHGATARASLAESVLVDLSRMNTVEIDAQARTARIQAGAQWQHVVGPAAEHGLAGLAGSAGDVCVTGYALGGGAGWLVRRYGYAANSIRSAEVVTAEARKVRVDADSEPDLFWAIRGGGGSFAVVTSLELELFPVGELYAGVFFWPQERAAEVLNAWSEWTADQPDEMTSLGRLLNVPPLEEIPEPLRGRSFVLVEAAWLGDEASGTERLAPLRALGPEMDTFAMIPPTGLAALHMDPPQPVPGAGDGILLNGLDSETIDALLGQVGPGTGAPLTSLEIRHLGGAAGRTDAGHGALDACAAPFSLFAVGMAPDDMMKAAVVEGLGAMKDALAPWQAGRFLNFTDQPGTIDQMFNEETYARLREVKARYDADDLIQSNHEVAPAGT